jgi:signal transduction histidine kinase
MPTTALPHVHALLAPSGHRALLTVPLLLEQRILGGLVVWRHEAGVFPDALIALLQTFAIQSSLAIQNAQLFRALAERGRELETATQHKSAFLAQMSHELRTPLNAILGYTELILDRIYGDVPEAIGGVMERVQHSGQHLLRLINAVLDLSRMESGKLALSITEYTVADVVAAVVTTVEQLVAEKHLTLRVTVPAMLPPGTGDAHRLTQVLLNLVGNAIAFTEVGEIGIAVSAADDRFTLVVWDTGPGIAVADQQRIFEAFQQVELDSPRLHQGTGLGLAIAKQIIEQHGGCIGVQSCMGQGSTFWCTIPIHVAPQDDEP